ncbi:MAG: hypothetical protein KBC11_00360 [Candidatus Pacebacteria bacterium]|nr:hypothetical protein [Candidatus Paceibacterota bacterium]
MADAPSGGSGWGTFEIILGLLLAIALLSNIGNKGEVYKPLEVKDTLKQKVVEDDTSNRCGLSVTAPLSLQKVSNSIRLSGSVNGCNWKPDGNTALFAQVVDKSGKPVSEFITVESNGSSILNTAFDTNINITGNPSGVGYLILIPATKQEKSITVRIPLTFVRN